MKNTFDTKNSFSRLQQVGCWAVHFYTALGLIAAAFIAVCIVIGDAETLRWVLPLMFVATIIDATDGTLARRLRVKEVLPGFDGRRLDDIIDFHTYTSLPLLFIWRASLLPPEWSWCLIVASIASIYGFCQVAAKTDDGYFLGFPSYWNLVAFYLYLIPMPGWISVGLVTGLAVLTFVPSKYLYPSNPNGGTLNIATNILGALWALSLMFVMVGSFMRFDQLVIHTVTTWSLLFPAFYLIASWVITIKDFRDRRRCRA